MSGEAASHLFQVISRRYEHGSVILTTNRGIASWGEIFEDTTVAAAILEAGVAMVALVPIGGASSAFGARPKELCAAAHNSFYVLLPVMCCGRP